MHVISHKEDPSLLPLTLSVQFIPGPFSNYDIKTNQTLKYLTKEIKLFLRSRVINAGTAMNVCCFVTDGRQATNTVQFEVYYD